MISKKILTITTITVLATFLMLVAIPASANVACGATLVADTTLTHNLSCSGTGLIIGADDITLDLNSFTLFSSTGSGFGVDNTGGFDDVTIKNGVISGFSQGIKATGVDEFTIKDITFTGDTSGPNAHVIDIRGDNDVTIKGVTITVGAGSPAFAEAIRLESIDGVKVSDVLVHGGFVGVNFACDLCNGSESPTNGEVKDSTFLHNFNGILIANSDDAKIKNNLIMDGVCLEIFGGFCSLVGGVSGSKGINIDFLSNSGSKISKNEIFNMGFGIRAQVGTHSDLEIKKNYIHDNLSDGMFLERVSTSKISKNIVTNNDGDGISLAIGSTGNELEENRADGNTGFDLTQDVTSSPNDWEDNTCDDSDDAGSGEIDCP